MMRRLATAKNHRTAALAAAVMICLLAAGACKDLPFQEKEVNFEDRVAEANPALSKEIKQFALAAMITPQEANHDYHRLVAMLSKETGQEAALVHGRSYSEVNKMLANGKMAFAFLCTGGYTHPSQEEVGVAVLAAPVVNGKMTYRSYVLVRKDAAYDSFAELKGARFAFTDPLSLTGYLYPHSRILGLGQNKESFFKSYSFVGSHDRAITSVRSGAADAAAVDALIFDFIKDRQPERVRGLKVLETSQPFGMPPVVAAPHVNSEDRTRWRRALLSLHQTQEGRAVLTKLGMERFGKPAAGLYQSARVLWKTER